MKNSFQIIFIFTGLLLGQTVQQIKQAKDVIKRTGMSESQVKDVAKAKGYTDKQIVDAIKTDKALESLIRMTLRHLVVMMAYRLTGHKICVKANRKRE